MEEDNELTFCKFVIWLNHQMKYVKAYNMQEYLWLFYEREVFENDDLEEVVRSMIYCLDAALCLVKRALRKDEKSDDNDGEGCTEALPAPDDEEKSDGSPENDN